MKKLKYNAYHDMAMHGNSAARTIREQNDKLHNRTFMTYEQFCDAIDSEIPKALFHMVDGHPSMPVGLMAKATAKMFSGDDPNHNYYSQFLDLLFG